MTNDASDYGLGAVLMQIHADKMEKTIAFASRTLTESERKYLMWEKGNNWMCVDDREVEDVPPG